VDADVVGGRGGGVVFGEFAPQGVDLDAHEGVAAGVVVWAVENVASQYDFLEGVGAAGQGLGNDGAQEKLVARGFKQIAGEEAR
jgi:hypothetical protein